MFYTNRSLLLSKLVKLVIKKKLTFGGINCHRYQNKKRKLVMNSCWGKKKIIGKQVNEWHSRYSPELVRKLFFKNQTVSTVP